MMAQDFSALNSAAQDDQLDSARFYAVKAVCEDDVYRSLKTSLWTSTDRGNEALDLAYREHADTGPIYLAVAVVSSGYFLGVCELVSKFTIGQKLDGWVGRPDPSGYFVVKWRYLKDIPNAVLKTIGRRKRTKPITRYRNAEEFPPAQGRALLQLFREYQAETSLLDDFQFYTERLSPQM
jgi:hypothetical protein